MEPYNYILYHYGACKQRANIMTFKYGTYGIWWESLLRLSFSFSFFFLFVGREKIALLNPIISKEHPLPPSGWTFTRALLSLKIKIFSCNQ